MKATHELRSTDAHRQGWLPLLEMSTREVFELMLNCQLDLPEIQEKEAQGVTAMVGLAGSMCGVLSVRCSAKAAARMTSRMLGAEMEETSPEMADAIGEICNMVAGNFKNKVAGLAERCLLSPPTVITGNDYCMHAHAEEPGLQVWMRFEGMPFVVSLQIQS